MRTTCERSGVNDYMKTLLTVVILCGLIGPVVAQQKETLFGKFVIGEVTEANETTREITIKYPGKAGPELFNGFLTDGYKIRLKDGSQRELKINEITPGIRVRAFYKSGKEVYVNGQKKKIYKIVRFEFLGKDEWVRLRDQLQVPSSTVVAQVENGDLPATSPLKVFLSSPYPGAIAVMVDWITKWNQKQTDSSNKLEVVIDGDQADVLLVVAKGSDTLVVVLPLEVGVGNEVIKTEVSEVTSYLVLNDRDGFKVLWTGITRAFLGENRFGVPKDRPFVTSELEKRLEARARPAKK